MNVRDFLGKLRIGVAASLSVLAVTCMPANASLIGALISVEAEGPLGTPQACSPNCFSVNPFVVGAGIETSRLLFAGGPDLWTADFAANSLTITYVGTATATIAPFQGPVFSILSGDPFGPILSISGIAPSAVFLTGGDLAVNFYPFTFTTGEQIVVQFGETPIPGALPLFATGLGALGLIAYRRRRKPAV